MLQKGTLEKEFKKTVAKFKIKTFQYPYRPSFI